MYKGIFKKEFFLLAFLIFLFACTSRKNKVGNPDSGITPIECYVSSDQIVNFYSYEDSIKSANSTKLVVANYQNKECFSLLKFLHLPELESSEEDTTIVENVNLKLAVRNNLSDEEITPTNLKLGLLDLYWLESYATWWEATDTTSWNNTTFSDMDFTTIESYSIETEQDSINIQFPGEIVKNWIFSDSTNYGIVLYTEESDNIFEFYSTETDFYPLLTFDYGDVDADSLTFYTSSNNLATDVTIYHKQDDSDLAFFADEMKIANMNPTKMYLKFDLDKELFIDPDAEGIDFPMVDDSGIDTEDEFHRMKIVRAELVLSRKVDNAYPLRGDLSFKPYLVVSENPDSNDPETPFIYPDDYISYGSATSDTLVAIEYSIDITDIVQTMISGNYDSDGDTFDYENHGFIIRSYNENFDLQYIDFFTPEAADDFNRPKLKIIYTPPFDPLEQLE